MLLKKVLYILLIFICQNIFSQEYHFDRFYEFTSKEEGVCFFMLNSSDKNYLFFGTSYNSKLTGYIFDYKTAEFHYYDVSNVINGLNFNYQNTKKTQASYSGNNIDTKIHFDYTVTKIDSIKESVKIVGYKQNRKRSNFAEVELIYDKSNNDYIFHISVLKFISHHFFDDREIENVSNRLPSLISYDYYNGAKFSYGLTKKQKINTTLTISKDQIKYIE